MSGLRFCMLTTFYPPHNFGGDGIGIQRLCHGLVRRGHEVTVVHDVDAFNLLHDGDEPEARPEPEGLEVHRLRSGAPLVSSLLTQQFGRPLVKGHAIRRILDEGRFDVVNFHNISLIGGPGILRYGDALKLYMAHEHWLVCPTHVLWRHGRERCDERQCLRCVLNHRRPPQLWRGTGFLGRELRHVDAFIAMSEFSRDKHREFGFPREMEVLPYFLPDLENDGADDLGPSPQERPYFLFVGRLEKIKGLDDVIPLFAGEGEADLLVAGDGEYSDELKRQARGLERVRFLGRVDPMELRRYYRHARALVVPSVCFETFGIILIEAFRQGTPVIARRLGPFPEIVDAAGAGLLFEDADELRSALDRLSQDVALREDFSDAGRAAFAERWCESAVVPRYLDLVRRTAERTGRRSVIDRLETVA